MKVISQDSIDSSDSANIPETTKILDSLSDTILSTEQSNIFFRKLEKLKNKNGTVNVQTFMNYCNQEQDCNLSDIQIKNILRMMIDSKLFN